MAPRPHLGYPHEGPSVVRVQGRARSGVDISCLLHKRQVKLILPGKHAKSGLAAIGGGGQVSGV